MATKKTEQLPPEVEVRYESHAERRAGTNVLVITRTETTTPMTGRGRAWDRIERVNTVQVVTLDEAESLLKAIMSGLVWDARQMLNPHPDESPRVHDGPTVGLWYRGKVTDGQWELAENYGEGGRFYSYDEAAQVWHTQIKPRDPLTQWAVCHSNPADDIYHCEFLGERS